LTQGGTKPVSLEIMTIHSSTKGGKKKRNISSKKKEKRYLKGRIQMHAGLEGKRHARFEGRPKVHDLEDIK